MIPKNLFTLFSLALPLYTRAMADFDDIEPVMLDDRDLEYDFEVPTPRYEALRPRASSSYSDPGELETESVTAQIQADIQATIEAFNNTNLPPYVASLINQALNDTLTQYISQTSTSQQLTDLASTIDDELTNIQSTLISDVANGTDYAALRGCIVQIVEQGGIEDGQTCLLDNGASIADIQQEFEQTVEQYNFSLPIQTVENLISQVNGYLNSTSLIPAAEELVNSTLEALLSVVSSTAGDYTSAILSAGDCFFSALEQDTYSTSEIYQCETQASGANGTTTVATTLTSLENAYRDIVNQYVGFLTPNVVEDIQAIGEDLLPQGDPGSPAASMQTQIDNAILSVVSSAAGNDVDIAYQLLDCLNVMYESEPGDVEADAAAQNCSVGSGVLLSQQLILDGYLQQFYGYLPPNLVEDLENLTVPADTSASQLQSQLQELFDESGAGPAYVTCYEEYENCVLTALQTVEAGGTAQTCTPGDGCTSPFTVPTESEVGADGSNPYSGAESGITADEGVSKKYRRLVNTWAMEVEEALKIKREELALSLSERGVKKRGISKKHVRGGNGRFRNHY